MQHELYYNIRVQLGVYMQNGGLAVFLFQASLTTLLVHRPHD